MRNQSTPAPRSSNNSSLKSQFDSTSFFTTEVFNALISPATPWIFFAAELDDTGFQFPDNLPDTTYGVETGRIMLQYTTAKEFIWALTTLVLFLSVAVNFVHSMLKQNWASCSKNLLLGRGLTFSSCCSMTKLTTRSFRLRFYTRRKLHLEHKNKS